MGVSATLDKARSKGQGSRSRPEQIRWDICISAWLSGPI